MIGSNVSTVGGLSMGFIQGKEWNCDCIQIYLTPSRTWKVPIIESEEIKKFRTIHSKSNIKEIVAHIPFLVNIASEDDELREKSVERLLIESKIASILGVPFLVLHPGSNRDKKKGLKNIIEGLNLISEIKYDFMPKILLETMSGQGSMLCSKFEEIQEILDRVNKPNYFGVCFDTAHVFIAGYNFCGYGGYEKVLAEFDEIVGIKKINTIHFNDAKTTRGSRNDRHAAIGQGKMGLQVFHAMLNDDRFKSIPKILEIPERDESLKTLKFLKKLQNEKHIVAGKIELSNTNILERNLLS